MGKGGQGYDDKEDERLAMKDGKMAAKDLKSTRARRDDARFEERMAKGGKLSSKAKYIPKRDIEEVEVDQNGKEKIIDGADLLDGIYVKKKAPAKKTPAKKKPTKKASGGEVKPKSNRGGNVGQIVKLAKEIRKDGEKWTDAVKRASAQLKK
jgi:hypothetical protein